MAPGDVTKQCSQCGEAKAGTAFSPNTTSPDGLRSNCKVCSTKCPAETTTTPGGTPGAGAAGGAPPLCVQVSTPAN